MVNKALKLSKIMDEERVGVSFQMPASLKKRVDDLCRVNDIKMTTFFNSLSQVAIDEIDGNQDEIILLGKKLAEEKASELLKWLNSGSLDADEEEKIAAEYAQLVRVFDLNEDLLNQY